MAYWILRSEPDAYSWDDLVRDKGTEWDGVRNYTARNFLKDMHPSDLALFYHSQSDKAAVGVMEITRAWQPDGTRSAGRHRDRAARSCSVPTPTTSYRS